MILGTAPTIGKPTVPQQEVVLHADGTTLDGWQTGNSTDDFDGDNRIAGKFIVFGGYGIKSGGIRIEGLSGLARTGNTKGATRAVAGFYG
ncbi:hypothetical protein P7H06_25945 [Paenibacillus larvae]|nr:hypothetical protein [Paenibacillus larvae]MDT2262245.1 hypothetical protein [Paenibacillus larvae]